MSKVTIKEWYRRVNAAWPQGPLPIPSEAEAMAGAKKLYRYALGKSAAGATITSGNRYSWVRLGMITVNPNRTERGVGQGWQAIVHDLSHYFHRRLNPGVRPHSGEQARLELRMIKQVLKRGWLNNTLVRSYREANPAIAAAAPEPDVKLQRYGRVLYRISKWETKLKRAQKALKTLARKRAYYEKHFHFAQVQQ